MLEHLNMTELQQLRTDWKDMKDKVDKMYGALMGNDLARDGGLVGRIEHLEDAVENQGQEIQGIKDLIKKQNEEYAIRTTKLELWQKVLYISIGFVAASIFSLFISKLF